VSILLVGGGGSLREAVARRLIAQGDEVRAVELDPGAAETLRSLGVHIARSAYLDPDLVERAAQNVRTIVVFDPSPEVMEPVLEGARFASVDRVVLCGERVPDLAVTALKAVEVDYVTLSTVRKGLFKKPIPDDRIAEAVDAADDLAGHPHLELDLTEPTAWGKLKLEAP
jgi:hypothetical protein